LNVSLTQQFLYQEENKLFGQFLCHV
jgi:hypothetical protein